MLAASTRPQPSQWQDIEAQISVLVDAGMRPADALLALLTIRNYVSGFTLEEQTDRMRGSTANDLDPGEFETALRAFADYPRLSEALREVGDPAERQRVRIRARGRARRAPGAGAAFGRIDAIARPARSAPTR